MHDYITKSKLHVVFFGYMFRDNGRVLGTNVLFAPESLPDFRENRFVSFNYY